MKTFTSILFLMAIGHAVIAQKHTPLPHGMLYGQKVNTLDMMPAYKLEAFMGKKVRVSTTISGKVLRVTQSNGGWFEMDGGSGRIIKVHFRDYGINLPTDLRGRQVIIEGVAQKQFIADDMQHFAGDTVAGKKEHQIKTNPKRVLSFEAKGLMVL
ncbi:hypothetical protein BEL04_21135 [Mucilaginibacter sp. PPCGB 2223]|uniref:DUF4920 domain-containing protein n=1 Tax=Mucilaginibacter sp. PPCGB 2223 TaxID=1886027 RepID=UPI000825B25A|nr:DUF4920 domain-containing protein [Mucilaginibacter sp. PPCGB 2223]OCX51209.1 hypothetical protein BEL04_21135 [Mucilaginibacter sp. PPCGB 2223]